jgi:hypothetical protein
MHDVISITHSHPIIDPSTTTHLSLFPRRLK